MVQGNLYSNWVVVWNNYPEDWEVKLKAITCLKYVIAGKEIAPTTGTPHLQMYIQVRVWLPLV